MNNRWLSLVLSVVFGSSLLHAAEGVHYEVLDNGLQIVVKENHTAPVAAVRIYVKTGSIHEQEYLGSGISHVFEHLISGGTTSTRSEEEIRDLLDSLGGRNNAYTTRGHTAYYITTTADKVGPALNLMADWMKNSTFPQNEYEREINVVLQELYKGREEPGRVMQKLFYETVFSTHTVRYPIIGYEELVKKITRDDIVTYYERMYVPNNMIVSVVGDFDAEEVMDTVKKEFSGLKRRSLPAISLPQEPRQLGARRKVLENPKLKTGYFRIGFRTVSIDHEDLYALDVLSYILSHGRSSRLQKRVVETDRLASSIFSYSQTPEYDAGLFALGGEGKTEDVEAAIEAALEEVGKVKTTLVTEEELAKAKRQKVADDVLYSQTAEDEAGDLGTNILTTGNPNFSKLYLERIKTVTAEEVRAVAAKYLVESNMTTVIMRPPLREETETAVQKKISGKAKMVTLENGLRLLVKRNPNVPVVSMQAYFLGGVRLEPKGKAGVSRLVGDLVTRGTKSMTAEQIAAAFDSMGGKIAASAGNNTLGINAEVLTSDFDEAFKIFADVILNPVLPEDEFKKLQARTLTELAQQDDNWQTQLYRLFRKTHYGDRSYGNLPLGTTDAMKSLTIDDIRNFHRNCVQPDNGVVAIYGDIDPDAVVAKVKSSLELLKSGKSGHSTKLTLEPGAEAKLVQEIDRGISAIMYGYVGMDIMEITDRDAMNVLREILNIRLHEELRGKRDLVYMAYGMNFVGLDSGFFAVMSAATPANMPKVEEIIRAELQKFVSSTVTDAELDKGKAVTLNSQVLANQTNADMGLQALLDELYGLGYKHSETYPTRINAITAADLQRVATKFFKGGTLVRLDGITKK